MEKTVVVNYRIQTEYCRCCEQKLQEVQTSEIREFEISKERIMQWTKWEEVIEFEDDLNEIIIEFVCETLSFFVLSSFEKPIIEMSELVKVKQFVLEIIKS